MRRHAELQMPTIRHHAEIRMPRMRYHAEKHTTTNSEETR